MFDKIFADVNFDNGWYTNDVIAFCGKQYTIYVCANSHRETDLITSSQHADYESFKANKSAIEDEIKNLLISYKDEDFLELLKPTGLVFERDGGYALLFDDESDLDNGIAV
ncbi:MAG: hypothetical protein LBE35_03685, partial [Clostridiales bacterium]|nr:hypothetical protein [Clostridiales bacterium]